MAKNKKSSNIFFVLFVLLIAIALPVIIISVQKNTISNRSYASSPDLTPIGQTGNWSILFSDEFNNTALDLSKWVLCNPSFASSCNPWNNEQEKFNTATVDNVNVMENNGSLHLIATKNSSGQIYSGMISSGPNKFGYNQPSYNGFQFTYGYVESRIKVPKGNGMWPSIWMLPDQDKYGAWPGSGEYDIFEIAGNDPTKVYMTEHDSQNGGPGDSVMATLSDLSADYHTYGFEWAPDHLAWYIDGIQARPMICTEAFALVNPGKCDSYRNAAAIKNYPFYVIANLSVGGSWPPLKGAPDMTTTFPASMDIDYIRIWQRNSASVTSTTLSSAIPSSTAVTIPSISKIQLQLILYGIGSDGNSRMQNSNMYTSPMHPQRQVTVEIYNTQNQLVLSKEGQVSFDPNTGEFNGSIEIENSLPVGYYEVKIKSPQFLKVQVPGIYNITPGTVIQLAKTSLITGDITGDNSININDYNILIGCYADLVPAQNCNPNNKLSSDLNDDGNVNMIDYNIFLRELSNNIGQ